MAISLKVWFGSKSTELSILEENHDKRRHLYFWCCAQKRNFSPSPLEYAKDQNMIDNTEISVAWEKGNFLIFSNGHLPPVLCKRVHVRSQLPLHEVKGVNNKTFNGIWLRPYCATFFDQEVAFR